MRCHRANTDGTEQVVTEGAGEELCCCRGVKSYRGRETSKQEPKEAESGTLTAVKNQRRKW